MENQNQNQDPKPKKISKSRVEELEAKEKELEALKGAKDPSGEHLEIEPVDPPASIEKPAEKEVMESTKCPECSEAINYSEKTQPEKCPSCEATLEWGN